METRYAEEERRIILNDWIDYHEWNEWECWNIIFILILN